jgi:threonylcarbamoyladenosine tRNA methylthiotransferase CDKAL1
MRVYVESYGCTQNQGEGAAIARDLSERGHEVVGTPDGADVGVLVTCAVIGPTEARMVRRWRALSERIPRMVVTGCMVPLRTGLLEGPARERTTFVPIREQPRISLVLDAWGSPRPDGATPAPGPIVPIAAQPPATEEIVIAQGCTSGCSYCFSRLARGRLESVPVPEVVRRVRAAVARGVTEVRLSSLDTAAWGMDWGEGARLPDLLEAVAAVPGDVGARVGMMSPQTLAPILEPYLAALAAPRFYRFLHLPVQSGSDSILRAMHRGYRVEEFRRLVRAARARFPDLALSTDVIVGFPGEAERDHRATEELITEVGPETVNVTRFSPRPGTPAALLPPLEPRVAKRRSRELTELRKRVARDRLERWIGHRGPARVVEFGPGASSVVRLSNYLPVVLDERPALGSTVGVRVDGARSTYLLGHVA